AGGLIADGAWIIEIARHTSRRAIAGDHAFSACIPTAGHTTPGRIAHGAWIIEIARHALALHTDSAGIANNVGADPVNASLAGIRAHLRNAFAVGIARQARISLITWQAL